MQTVLAGIDVHKRMLAVAVGSCTITASAEGEVQQRVQFKTRRFGTTAAELEHLAAWLSAEQVQEAVMESTAQYWKPVWLALEPHLKLRLAQAWSNRAPRGKKTDFKDAQRLVRRHLAGELTLSYVPEAAVREMRTVMRRRKQLTRDRIRLQSQLEALLEEGRVKLSSFVSDLLGASGMRILTAMANGETDPVRLAALGDERLKCSREELAEALAAPLAATHRLILGQYLAQLAFLKDQMEQLAHAAAELMRPHEEALARLVRIPGIGLLAAQQIMAEAGPDASAFPSAAHFSSWAGVCPGRQEKRGGKTNPAAARKAISICGRRCARRRRRR